MHDDLYDTCASKMRKDKQRYVRKTQVLHSGSNRHHMIARLLGDETKSISIFNAKNKP